MEEFRPGIPPSDPHKEIEGLQQAIKKAEQRKLGPNTEVDTHLTSLKQQLQKAKEKLTTNFFAK